MRKGEITKSAALSDMQGTFNGDKVLSMSTLSARPSKTKSQQLIAALSLHLRDYPSFQRE